MPGDLVAKKRELISYLQQEGFLKTPAVIEAFKAVPREKFVPADARKFAYANEPLDIGHGQTISQPLTVAVMTEALDVHEGQKVLEVGTGSGYQAAILANIVGAKSRVISTERIPELVKLAKKNLAAAKITNVEVVEHDGTKGYAKEAPYDRIIVTASALFIPDPLIEQLKPGGKMIIPVETELWMIHKHESGKIHREMLGFYAFVPLIGEYGHRERVVGG
jgi:protein-L-isoaspartate(D-aspartate) O-methyltransferase